ncbi:MAG: fatty acyl-AMP ligase, partial [Sphingomonadales bacterium]
KVGRIFVKGVSVMRGYFGDVETTIAVLSKDGWLDTGDMGYMLDGHLFIVGRAKDLIIVNGCNYWPQDIEWAAEQLPGVRSGDIAAISLPGENAEEVPAVLVQCRLRDSAEREDFAKTIKTEINSVTGVNCRIELVPPRTLPRTPSGKLARAKARAQFLAGGLSTPA